MPEFSKQFYGAPDGAIYPRFFEPGEECPPELIAAARLDGALAEDDATAKPARKRKERD